MANDRDTESGDASPFTYAVNTDRATWLLLVEFASHHTVDPVGMLQCFPGFSSFYMRAGRHGALCGAALRAKSSKPMIMFGSGSQAFSGYDHPWKSGEWK